MTHHPSSQKSELADAFDLIDEDAVHYSESMERFLSLCFDSSELKDKTILDLGCGTGLFIKTARGLGGYMIAVDSSKKMIQKAKLKHGKKAFFLCADADYLPFRDQIFNDVFVFTLFQNMPDPKVTIKEIRRVTKMEAKVVVTLLKRAQSGSMFQNLLNTAGLNVILFIDKDELKDYVAICELFR